MTSRHIRETLENATVRVEKIWWLDAIDFESPPADLLEELWDAAEPNPVAPPAHPPLADLVAPPPAEGEEPEWIDQDELAEALFENPPTGWVVVLERPVPRSFSENHGETYSWGLTRRQAFLLASLEELGSIAWEFSNRVVDEAKARMAEKAGGASAAALQRTATIDPDAAEGRN